MVGNMQTQISKDFKNKKVSVIREFDAALDLVWKAWTESRILDQWWAPLPWIAKTKSMDFREKGSWLYAMSGPDGTSIWNTVEFISIEKKQRFQAVSFFCDENGIKNSSLPTMQWKNVFITNGSGTTVEVELSFTKEADMEQIIAMGFESGFSDALGNLDQLLKKGIQ